MSIEKLSPFKFSVFIFKPRSKALNSSISSIFSSSLIFDSPKAIKDSGLNDTTDKCFLKYLDSFLKFYFININYAQIFNK